MEDLKVNDFISTRIVDGWLYFITQDTNEIIAKVDTANIILREDDWPKNWRDL